MLKQSLLDHYALNLTHLDVADPGSVLDSIPSTPDLMPHVSVPVTPDAIINGTLSNDFIHMAGDGAVAHSVAAQEFTTATNDTDFINGSDGDDTIYGDGGDDLLTGGPGNDYIDGGTGNNTASYSGAARGVTVDLRITTAQNTIGDGTDTLVNIQNLQGTSLADTLNGDDHDNMIMGGGGTDSLSGNGGNDHLFAGDSNGSASTLDGGAGNDVLEGSSGKDTFIGGGDNDTITSDTVGSATVVYSGADTDYTLTLLNGTYTIVDNRAGSPDGTDTFTGITNIEFSDGTFALNNLPPPPPTGAIAGTGLNDFIHEAGDGAVPPSGTYNEIATATEGDNTIYGSGGDDALFGAGGNDVIDGGVGNDYIDGGTGFNIASYADNTTGVTVDLRISGPQNTAGGGTDTLVHIQYLIGSAFADTLNGDNVNNLLISNGGNDTLNGNGGSDWLRASGTGNVTMDGGTGDDALWGSGGNDTFTGGAGNDSILGGGGNDTAIYTGAHTSYTVTFNASTNTYTIADNRGGSPDGTDTVTGVANFQFSDGTFAATSFNPGTINGTSGNDFIHVAGDHAALPGGGYNEITTATNANDTILGQNGDDAIYGGGGDDFIFGGAGNDQMAGGAGNDTIDGGTGFNLVSYADAIASVTVDLSITAAQNTGGGGTDTLSNIQYLIGSAFADTLSGDGNSNMLISNGGNDTLNGNGGDDWLRGTNGGAVTMNGGDGNDTLSGSSGNNTLNGGNGNDTIAGGVGNDTLNGGDGNDTITGGGGTDSFVGGAGDDQLTGGTGNDTFIGGAGNDSIVGVGGTDTAIFSGNKVDYLIRYDTGLSQLVMSDARAGHPDGQDGLSGITYVQFADGTVTVASLIPPAGTINGSDADDTLVGTSGNDTINGFAGNDILYGEGGTNMLNGGDGNDVMHLYGGANTVDGGTGVNTITFEDMPSGQDPSTPGVTVSLLAGTASTALGNDTIVNVQNVTGTNYNDTLTGDNNDNVIHGNGGADRINGLGGNDQLYSDVVQNAPFTTSGSVLMGGDGDDVIHAKGFDVVDGGAGNDTMTTTSAGGVISYATVTYADATSGVTVDLSSTTAQDTGGAGVDTLSGFGYLTGTAFADTLKGDNLSNGISGGGGSDTLIGNGGDDWLRSDGPANVSMEGDAGSDYLLGNTGNDTLNGGTGNDTLVGGAGADLFIFHLGDGLDTVTDFIHSTDHIEMDGYGIADFATLQSHISQSGGDAIINIDSNDIITLKGVTASTLTASDFTFH